ncbi:dipeptide ABC transporter ATP-binding protein [Lysinibacillus sp. NPDC097231]|uniref:dipeptide ABC transporter ATP-binding protein n=1 Tax=Lysinibacillus sp. NPDC097231 TaxID=3364142 RepID=UPI0038263852
MEQSMLEVKNLTICYQNDKEQFDVVRNLSFSIPKGRTLSIVGESGSGKTVTALSISGLLPLNGQVRFGEILLNGESLLNKTESEWNHIRAKKISMVFQDPMTALNPVMTIYSQLAEAFVVSKNHHFSKKELEAICIDLLEKVGLNEAPIRLKQYPHELSGGMRQRVMIAIALASEPDLLIADEPTTALDSTVKKQILDLLIELKEKVKLTILLITHDLSETLRLADDILVMYAGKAVEYGSIENIINLPKHPYTQALLKAIPNIDANKDEKLFALEGQPPNLRCLPSGCSFHPRCKLANDRCRNVEPVYKEYKEYNDRKVVCFMEDDRLDSLLNEKIATKKLARLEIDLKKPVFEAKHITKQFKYGNIFNKKAFNVVDNVSFQLYKGEVLAIVGESGAGKSTLWQTLFGIHKQTAGDIYFLNLPVKNKKHFYQMHGQVGFVFQNSYSSLNPKMPIEELLKEPLRINNWPAKDRNRRIEELLQLVGLPLELKKVYPHQMSGGQRQRVSIARAIANNPKLLVLDEPVSALDVSIQAQIINLLMELRQSLQISMIFISHDLALTRYIADRIVVMHQGKIVELGYCEEVINHPKQPYTKTLIDAAKLGSNKVILRK